MARNTISPDKVGLRPCKFVPYKDHPSWSHPIRHPAMFCSFLHEKCTELGMRTFIGTPISLDSTNHNLYIVLDSSTRSFPFEQLVLCAGPWSALTAQTLGLPVPPISNIPGHSILIRPRANDFDPCAVCESAFAGLSPGSIGTEAADADPVTGGASKNSGYTRSIEFVTRYAIGLYQPHIADMTANPDPTV